jgi:hypothetical protein
MPYTPAPLQADLEKIINLNVVASGDAEGKRVDVSTPEDLMAKGKVQYLKNATSLLVFLRWKRDTSLLTKIRAISPAAADAIIADTGDIIRYIDEKILGIKYV